MGGVGLGRMAVALRMLQAIGVERQVVRRGIGWIAIGSCADFVPQSLASRAASRYGGAAIRASVFAHSFQLEYNATGALRQWALDNLRAYAAR